MTRHKPCAWFRVRVIRVRSTYANRSRINLYINFISTSCLVDSMTYADQSHAKCFRQGSCHSVSTFVVKLFISDTPSITTQLHTTTTTTTTTTTRQLRTNLYQMLANCRPNSCPEFCQKYARNISETCQTYVRNMPEICHKLPEMCKKYVRYSCELHRFRLEFCQNYVRIVPELC